MNGARHHGTLNVLFKDGHVDNFLPADVDPTVAQIYQTSWLPAALAELSSLDQIGSLRRVLVLF